MAQGMARSRLTQSEQGYASDWPASSRDEGDDWALDFMLWPLARSAAQLLVPRELDRVKQCPGPEFCWLFLNTSRNRSQGWCIMKLCWSRASVASHYRRGRSHAP